MTRHRHTYTRAVLDRPEGAGRDLLCLACECGHVHPVPIYRHRWARPGRALAHGRPVVCSCHDLELTDLAYTCQTHGEGPHAVRPRADRDGARLICRECSREEVAAREIDPEVSREAARAYQRRRREAERAMRGEP